MLLASRRLCRSVARCTIVAWVLLEPGAECLAQTVVSPSAAQVFTTGYVYAVARQSNGKIVIAGSFDSVHGVPRNGLARLNADGSLDTTWDPDPGGLVNALVVDASNVYVGGFFSTIGGQVRHNLAKLPQAGDGTPDRDWQPEPGGPIDALALDGIGNIYVGGDYGTIGGQSSLHYLAKVPVAGTGSADPVWGPIVNNPVGLLAVSGTSLFVGGNFTSIGGVSRFHLAKVSTAGAGATDASWDPSPDGNIFALTADSAGRVYVGGDFSNIGGSSRLYVARIPGGGSGAIDATWTPNIPFHVQAFVVESSSIYVGGNRSAFGLQQPSYLAKVSVASPGTIDPLWNPAPDDQVFALTSDGNGSVTAGGYFTRISGKTRLGIATLNGPTASVGPGGPATPAWAIGTQLDPDVSAIVRDSTGRTVIGGVFQFMGDGTRRNNLARLNADGSVDITWDPSPDNAVTGLAIDPSGNVFVGGLFRSIGGEPTLYIAKLSGTGAGAADPSWKPTPDDIVRTLTTDGTDIYVSGDFATIGGQSRSRLAKVFGTGTGVADPFWNPGADNWPTVLVFDAGSLYAAGYFTSIGGQSRQYLAKLSATGSGAVDPDWDPNPNGGVSALAADGLGNIYATGGFYTIGGEVRNGLARLSEAGTGAADPTWSAPSVLYPAALAVDAQNVYVATIPSVAGFTSTGLSKFSVGGKGGPDPAWAPQPDAYVNALSTDGAGNVYAGGSFTTIAGQPRNSYAVLAPYTTSLTSSGNPSPMGVGLTLTATLAGSVGSPTGTATFQDGNNAIAGCTAVPMIDVDPATCTTSTLTVGSHTITVAYSSDVNYGVSSVGTLLQIIGPAPPSSLVNPSFETPALGSGFQYNPSGAGVGWTFSGNSGIQHNGSAWGAAAAPDGVQTAFVQSTSSISQALSLNAGNYTLGFKAAQRNCCLVPNTQPIKVTVDGTQIGGLVTPASTSFGSVSIQFTVASTGVHTIAFVGTNPNSNATFIDAVTLAAVVPGTTLASSLNPAKRSQSVTFTATVTGTNPTGTVGFTSNGSPITGCTAAGFSGGSGNVRTAQCVTSFAVSGSYNIVANYSGNGSNAPTSSTALVETIKAKQ